jgi:hypothetical protein
VYRIFSLEPRRLLEGAMIIYEFQVEDLEDGSWLFATKKLAKAAAETSMRDNISSDQGKEAAARCKFFWVGDRLYVRLQSPEATAYIVRPRTLYEALEGVF